VSRRCHGNTVRPVHLRPSASDDRKEPLDQEVGGSSPPSPASKSAVDPLELPSGRPLAVSTYATVEAIMTDLGPSVVAMIDTLGGGAISHS